MKALLLQLLAERACVYSYLAALEAEGEALAERRFEPLAALTAHKGRLLERLAEIDAAREDAQVALGLPPGAAGCECAAALDPCVHEAWDALVQVSRRAKRLNAQVAASVYTHLDFTSTALAVLRSRGAPLYGRDGSRALASGGASLGAG